MATDADILTAHEAGMFLGAHVETIRRLARRGDIPSFKVGKDWRFSKQALIEWMKSAPVRQNIGTSVLIVDDDEKTCLALSEMVAKFGCQGRWTTSGREGLRMLAADTPDVVLLDLRMPEMSGVEFLGHLRATEQDLPVVVVTGYPQGRLMEQAMKYGPILLLAKPVDRALLERTIRVAVGKSLPRAVGE